ncbi:N-acetylmuramoyl-L-alanine amidase [Niastella caeni]|uniref:N-acetylmuramoyl-L-alanine amidase n=1 Tax=Niastella caeni TaxID=2569763 RepID=A0A4S8HM52_9BACT|nr:N-acetylmuramoyl-L-alanine amidase [Niastella caeni]THU34864.1 N-acetylmuramoyl-L-alanine amidase [Niastella caeni]
MLQKLIYCLLGTGFCMVVTAYRTAPAMPNPIKPGIKTIIIDAGHGGHDPGAHGDYSNEKSVCLAIALKLGKKLEEEFPDIKIFYTRTKDTYPAIKARADFANSHKGDLFISIHANAAPKIKHSKFIGYKTQVYYTRKGKKRIKHTRRVKKYKVYYTDNPSRGTETYIWAADRSDEKGGFVTERMAEEVNDSTEYAPDINDPEFKAKSLLWTKRYFTKSLLLANLVQEEVAKDGRLNRGVKQRNEKGIWVLQATAMPSILVETGYITHSADEAYLNSQKGQNDMASAIVKAVKRYRAASSAQPVSQKHGLQGGKS